MHQTYPVGLLVVLCALGGCSLLLSPRERLVLDALSAVCEKRDIVALTPYVTDSSKIALSVAGAVTAVGDVFGFGTADRLAIECETGKEVDFVEEVKVTDSRYIVRARFPKTDEAAELVVVLQRGEWKLALLGR